MQVLQAMLHYVVIGNRIFETINLIANTSKCHVVCLKGVLKTLTFGKVGFCERLVDQIGVSVGAKSESVSRICTSRIHFCKFFSDTMCVRKTH